MKVRLPRILQCKATYFSLFVIEASLFFHIIQYLFKKGCVPYCYMSTNKSGSGSLTSHLIQKANKSFFPVALRDFVSFMSNILRLFLAITGVVYTLISGSFSLRFYFSFTVYSGGKPPKEMMPPSVPYFV